MRFSQMWKKRTNQPFRGGWAALCLSVLFVAGGIVVAADRGKVTQATKAAATAPRTAGGVAADPCVDNDGDGYGSANFDQCPHPEPDCDDDPGACGAACFPGNPEICGDGFDNDCNGLTDGADPAIVLVPDPLVPVFGFETRGKCCGTNDDCDLRTPELAPPGCLCFGTALRHNFNQVIQACVDGGTITGPCDNGDPSAPAPPGSPCPTNFAIGDVCATGGTCVPVPVRQGEPCMEGNGVCRRLGTVVCDNGNVICDAVPGDPGVEGGGSPDARAHDPSCFDQLDNDCDGLVDHEDPACQTPERCDGFDNDNDGVIDNGLGLNEDCIVNPPGAPLGTPCQNTGKKICGPDGSVVCSVNANPPDQLIETACGDGKDNDCDGLIDCDDPDCTSPAEICDGKDNNCNGQIDEGFTGLGDLCVVGKGACQAVGILVCNADHTGVTCSASPGASSPERRTAGKSCSDGIDNDCDGLIDNAEPECQAGGLKVECSLVYDGPPDRRKSETTRGRGEPGADCGGWNVPLWQTTGAVGNVTCSAVLKAVMPDETIAAVLPVKIGERSHLVSRISPEDWKWSTKTNGRGVTTHEVFAPVPLLEVTCRDDATTAMAFCSNVPWSQIVKPSGGVVSGSAGDEIQVLASLPRVEPRTLRVTIDCVDIIPQLVPNPATQLPGGPFSGPVNVNGHIMQIKDLFVRTPKPTESSIEHLSANTLTMTVIGSGCGGHAIVVDGNPAHDLIPNPPPQLTQACYFTDDLRDLAQWSVFKLDITAPFAGQIIDNGGSRPTSINVQGDVCGGKDVESVLINGFVATLPAPTIVDGGPDDCAGSSKTVTMHINENVPVTNMAAVFAGTQSTLGSFDPGPNKLVGQATDVGGNTTQDLVPFVVGPAIPAPGASMAAAMGSTAAQAVVAHLNNVAADPFKIPKAFTLVLDDTKTVPDTGNKALKEFFDTVIKEFSVNLANCLLQPHEFCCEKELEMPWWTCNPDVTFCVSPEILQTPEQFADTFIISVTPHDGFVTLRFEVPEFAMHISGHGNCCTGGCGFFCVSRTKVDFDSTMTIPNIAVEIEITEANILQQDGTFLLRFFPGGDANVDIDGLGTPIHTGCGLFSIGTLIDVLTFGISAIPRVVFNGLADIIGFVANHKGIDLCPFVKEIAKKDGMQEKSDDQTMCKEDLGTDFDVALTHTIDAVEITDKGIALIMGVTVSPTLIDPQADPIPGSLMTEAPPVLPGSTGTENFRSISVAISDDFWNQLLAGMYQSGKFKSSFTKVFDLGKYFPDCSTITGGAIADRRRARCVGTTQCNNASDFDGLDRCQACLNQFPFRTCGGAGVQTCTLGPDCPGTCVGVCAGGSNPGTACNSGLACFGIGSSCVKTCSGGPHPGTACTLDTQCRDDCIGCLADDDDTCTRGVCVRAARRARDRKINANTQIVLLARLDSPPAFYLVDDPSTPDKIDIIFRSGEMRAALIANRDGNNTVNGLSLGDGSCGDNEPCVPKVPCDDGQLDQLDLAAVPDCSLDSLASNVDCILWSTCIDLNIQFAIGVHNETVNGQLRPQLDFELVGIVEPPPGVVFPDLGEQCGGPEEMSDLDFLNTESTRNDARKGMERKFCQSTPPFQSCGNDFNGVVQFLNPALLTVKNCTNAAVCDLDFADYLVITGDLRSQGLGTLIADKVCKKLDQKISESTGTCESGGDGGDENKEKLCP